MRVALSIIVGILAGFLLLALAGGLLVSSGLFNIAATVPPGPMEISLAGRAFEASLRKRAPRRQNPFPPSPETIAEGMDEYRENCLICHGAPGLESSEIAKGLSPAPPDLTLPRTQSRTDGQLFWIVAQGIRMTGMPAFAPTHDEEEIWKSVAFVRHLPQLTEQERAQLATAGEEEERHHHGEAHPPGTPPHHD